MDTSGRKYVIRRALIASICRKKCWLLVSPIVSFVKISIVYILFVDYA